MSYDMTKPRANNNIGMFIISKCYRCDRKSVTVVHTKHPLFKRMCKDCRDYMAKKKSITA